MTKPNYTPKYLGQSVDGPIDEIELIPWDKGTITVHLNCSEFTTFCPVTGQPDFGQLKISYIPDAHLIETKSLKLFLQNYREIRGFNEQIIAELGSRINLQLKPKWLKINGSYNPRGGISLSCDVEYGSYS